MRLLPRTTVALLQGNATVARIIRETLQASGLEVQELRGPPPGAEGARLVIVDVDSAGVDARRWLRFCQEQGREVLVCGVASSRAHFTNYPWLARPFSTRQLERVCEELLREGGSPRSESTPGAIEIHEPVTLELDGDDASKLEAELGLLPGALGGEPSDSELFDVIDLDTTGSMILEIEDLPGGLGQGGVLVAPARRSPLDLQALQETPRPPSAEVDVTIDQVISPSTFPEVPAAIEVPTLDGSHHEATTITALEALNPVDPSRVHQVANLIAEHWDRLGLTSRPDDRAERLERLLNAMIHAGLDDVVAELRRVPKARGFSGSLETLPVVDLLHTVRERRLRGRLEVSMAGRSFVLYLEGNRLQEIESLGESTDGVLLEVLRAEGALDTSMYQELARQLRHGQLAGGPLEMHLRRERLVDDLRLRDACKERARRLLRQLCATRRGGFAFVDVPQDSGFAWPVRGLNLKVDQLLLEILREVSLDTGHSEATARTRLVLDTGRAVSVDPDSLTSNERQLLSFFEQGQTLAEARARLGDTGEEPVERVVQRLKRMELLKRKSNVGEPIVAVESRDPHDRPTAVSNWEIDIPGLDQAHQEEGSFSLPADEEDTRQERGFSAGVPPEERSASVWDEELDSIFSAAADAVTFRKGPQDDDETY
ncbi:hypothetical protein DL240_05415 [Lujinxingia litoralis]|uniref:PatA-like N-terminal domain-containing protein n=1 Tax=Lujinxingia litoralis TaxID=2211119 RepID=A0A328CAV9_9DELT|nr:DUF4388 domain-containing protein [Lujinxingia litoralis]RAL23599.1 hypothetical protein DL240_05415 [Lujinxingia litoralis]